MPGWEIFPFENDGLTAKVLDPPAWPEPDRNGEHGPDGCYVCGDTEPPLWSDDRWLVRAPREPMAIPACVTLSPVAHHDLADLPPDLASELGPMLQRVERAIYSIGGVGRVHVNKWGDGGAHLHMFLLGRPAGMWQLRGSCLPLWDDILPKLDPATWDNNHLAIADALHADEAPN